MTSFTENKKQELEHLKKEYSYLLNNQALTAIATWRDPLDYVNQLKPEATEEQYIARFKKNLPAIKQIMDNLNGNVISGCYIDNSNLVAKI